MPSIVCLRLLLFEIGFVDCLSLKVPSLLVGSECSWLNKPLWHVAGTLCPSGQPGRWGIPTLRLCRSWMEQGFPLPLPPPVFMVLLRKKRRQEGSFHCRPHASPCPVLSSSLRVQPVGKVSPSPWPTLCSLLASAHISSVRTSLPISPVLPVSTSLPCLSRLRTSPLSVSPH